MIAHFCIPLPDNIEKKTDYGTKKKSFGDYGWRSRKQILANEY